MSKIAEILSLTTDDEIDTYVAALSDAERECLIEEVAIAAEKIVNFYENIQPYVEMFVRNTIDAFYGFTLITQAHGGNDETADAI